MHKILNDVRYAMRGLVKNYGFAAVTSLMLAFGLGLVSFMFTAVNAFWLMELPFERPQELLHIELARPAQDQQSLEMAWPDYVEYAKVQQSFRQVGAFYSGTVNLSGDDRPERFDGSFVSASTFDILGVKPHLGRGFVAGEDEFGAPLVAVLGYNTWRNRFNEDPGVVGRVMRINGREATIVGIMPPGFKFPFQQEIWVPMQMDPAANPRGQAMTLEVFGRVKPGVTREQVASELSGVLNSLAEVYPDTNAGFAPVVKPYKDEFVGNQTKRVIGAMFVACVLVLLIACANVANLMLVRAMARTREIAVRSALGASRMRIITGMLAETLVIAMIGAVLGLGIAHLGAEAITRVLEAGEDPPPYFIVFQVDWRVISFALLAAFVTALIAGIMPALRASKLDVNQVIKDAGRGMPGAGLSGLTRTLVIGEIALSCVLLVAAGLMVRSIIKAQDADFGVETAGIVTGRVGLFPEQYPTEESRRQLFDTLERELRAVPGVREVAITTSVPVSFMNMTAVLPEGSEPPAERSQYPFAGNIVITPAFFDVLGVALQRGRLLGLTDRVDTERVVVVNQAFVERYLAGKEPVGQRLRMGFADDPAAPVATIVGVVGNVLHRELDDGIWATVYSPLAQADARFASFVVKTDAADPMALAPQLRTAVQAADRDLPVYWLRSLQDWIDIALFDSRLMGGLFGIFAGFALLLGAAGIYAVLAYSVAQRTREIGVRRALGAHDEGILRMIMGQGGRQLAVGLVIGLPLALGFAQVLGVFLIDISTWDPVTYLVVLAALALVTAAASAVPAWRATRVHPMEALRYE